MENGTIQGKGTVFSDALFEGTKDLTEEELETVKQFHPARTRPGAAKPYPAMPDREQNNGT